MFYEIVVAPGYTPEGLEVLKGKSKALRILEAKPRPPSGRSLRQVAGGWLLQVRMIFPDSLPHNVMSCGHCFE
jgi:phosphoribosylaminoimidazolecarboxamide formyltransferase/IMP cyclohydrolase